MKTITIPVADDLYQRASQKAAAARIDRVREENARRFDIQDVTLDAVRESRS